MFTKLIGLVLVLLMAAPSAAQTASAQTVVDSASAWRNFAEHLDAGAPLKVRLRDGRRLKATFIGAGTGEIVLQPKTRVPVPVQAVPYDDIVSLERDTPAVSNVGKAIVIGTASGAGAFLGLLLLLFAAGFD
jgi:hypothetical protein